MPAPKSLHLHAGPHKTATTHLQVMLRANKAWLGESGIAVQTPKELAGWMQRFRQHNRSRGWRRRLRGWRIRQSAPDCRLWLFSLEDFGGDPGDVMRHPTLFQYLPDRLRIMQKLFPDTALKLFFCLRSYDNYLRSSYHQLLCMRGYFPWSEFHDMERFSGQSWLELIDRVAQVLPAEQIVLWRYEDFRAVQKQVLQALTGLQEVDVMFERYGRKTTHPSLSARAIEELRKGQHAAPGTAAFKEHINHLKISYPAGTVYPREQPWRAEELAQLRSRYEQDIEKLRKRQAGIQWLLP